MSLIAPERAFFAYTALLNSVTAFVLGLVVLKNSRRDERTWVFIGFCASIAWWNFFYFLWIGSNNVELAKIFHTLNFIGAPLTPPAFFHFVAILTERKERYRWAILAAYVVTILAVSMNFSPFMISGFRSIMVFPVWPIPGPLIHIPLNVSNLVILISFYEMFQGLKRFTGLKKEQIRYTLISSLIAVPGGMSNYLPYFGIEIKPYGSALVFAQVAIMAYAVFRYRLISMHLATRNVLVYMLFGLLLAGPLLMASWVIQSGVASAVLLITGVLLAPFFFQRVKDTLEHAVNQLPVFKDRYDRFRSMREVMAQVEQAHSLEEWAKSTVQTVQACFHSKSANILLWDESQQGFFYRGGFGHSPAEQAFLLVPADSPLVSFARSHKDLILVDLIDRYKIEGLPAELQFLQAAVSIPIFIDQKLRAFLNVGELPDNRMFTELDLTHLENLARAAERSLRLVLTGVNNIQTSSLWAHDLIKPFGAKGAIGRLKEVAQGKMGDLSPEAAKALKLALDEMSFIQKNLQGILRPDHAVSGAGVSTVLGPVFDGIQDRFKAAAEEKGISLTVAAPGNHRVICDPESLEHRVLNNLVENAIRHTSRGGSVKVGVTWRPGECEISVADTGPGIAPAEQERIFQARVQGESGGDAGLGLYIARQVAEQQGGTLTVKSEPGKGATFFVRLPAYKI